MLTLSPIPEEPFQFMGEIVSCTLGHKLIYIYIKFRCDARIRG